MERLTNKDWHTTKFMGLNEREVLHRLWKLENILEILYENEELSVELKEGFTVVEDRYAGTYSKAIYTAWSIDYWEIPKAVYGNDTECREFWYENSNSYVIGKGATKETAIEDLKDKLSALHNEN